MARVLPGGFGGIGQGLWGLGVEADPFLTRGEAEATLFGGQVWFVPIRHHSPACAWALRAALRALQPEVVLIEAPSDLAHHLPLLTEPETVWPVAILALGKADEEGVRPHSYLPFAEHAPETVALLEAKALGAEVRFIDLACGASRLTAAAPVLQPEAAFDSNAFIAETCARLGLRDGAELWDHLFETRLGQPDWRGFFCDVLAYCIALRACTPPEGLETDGTLRREAAMRRHLAAVGGKRALVVTGGFHTPALCLPGAAADPPPEPAPDPVESYVIGYGEEALDALSGYGAGLRYPAWHRRAWRAAELAGGVPDWQALAQEVVAEFAVEVAAKGRRMALPQRVEVLALAGGLAAMKGRAGILLPDLFDGLRTALVKGEAGPTEPWGMAFHGFLRGKALGRAPLAAGQPPLVRDARQRAAACRFDLATSVRRARKLDFRRKPTHAAASRFCHQMAILDCGFGVLTAGPDLVGGQQAALLFEEWETAWTPFVEGRLAAAAGYGPTVPDAAAHKLDERRLALPAEGKAQDPMALCDLLLRGLRAGLGSRLQALLNDLTHAVGKSGDLAALAEVLRRLMAVAMPGDPLHDPLAPDLHGPCLTLFDRMIYLCDDLPTWPDDQLAGAITGLRLLFAAALSPEGQRFDRSRLDQALARMMGQQLCPPLLLGAVAGLRLRAGWLTGDQVARLLRGRLGGVTLEPAARAAALDGFLRSAPMMLWQSPEVLAAVNAVIAGLDDDGFVTLLPALRLSLTQLNPHETDRLAAEVAGMLGVSAGQLTQGSGVSEADLALGLAVDRALMAEWVADGLAHWGAADA